MTGMMSEPAHAGQSPFVNVRTVSAIIRKDMRTLWPLAAAVAAINFLVAGFFQEQSDFPDFLLDFGKMQIHVDAALYIATTLLVLVGTALFVVMLVQQDRAAHPLNDWMSRPIKAGEIIAAKVLTIGAVALAPTVAGAFIAVLTQGRDIEMAVVDIYFLTLECAFFLALGWLCSGTVQAVLATIGMGLFTILLVSISASVSELRGFTPIERPAAAVVGPRGGLAAPIPPPPQPTFQRLEPVGRTAPPIGVNLRTDDWIRGVPMAAPVFVLLLGGVGVTLWLLVGRRQVLAARLVFAGSFAVSVLTLTQSVAVVDVALEIRPSTLEQRIASFAKNDANGDGKLDKPEYQSVLNELGFPDELDNFWVQRDRDGDGFLSLEEIKPEIGFTPPAASLEQRMEAFTKYDADQDNKLTKEEYALAMRSLGFGGLVETYWPLRDLDKDGFVTIAEYVPAVQAPPPQPIEQPAAATQQGQ
jgi:hypothetical protein